MQNLAITFLVAGCLIALAPLAQAGSDYDQPRTCAAAVAR